MFTKLRYLSMGPRTDAFRTLARSRQIEAEGRGSARHPITQSADSFTDDPEEQAAAATLLRDDQIDFLDHEEVEGYRDEFTNDDDVFRYGDGDEEEGAIGLDKQPSQR
jgi:hypothetical protein